MVLLLAASISTTRANRKTHIVNHLQWTASYEDARFRQPMSKFGHRLDCGILRHVACGSEL